MYDQNFILYHTGISIFSLNCAEIEQFSCIIRKHKRKKKDMKDIKIIFFDIDGTLIAMDKDTISDNDHEGTLYRNCIPSKDIETIVNNAVKIGRPVALATKDRMAANGKDQDLIDYYAFGNAEVEVAKDFEEVKKETVYQVLMGARKEEYQDILKGVQAAEITAWWNRAVDIIPINAGKGIGIEKVLKYYGIEKSQSMAFGDGNNDIEMLKAVGNGIAMGNASDDLKAVADEICGDVSEDGIYQYCLENELI